MNERHHQLTRDHVLLTFFQLFLYTGNEDHQDDDSHSIPVNSSPALLLQSQPIQKGQQMLNILIYYFEFCTGTRLKGAAPPVGGLVASGGSLATDGSCRKWEFGWKKENYHKYT